jgi:hypothetical protein
MTNADPARSRRYWKINHHSVDSTKKFTFNQYLLIQSHRLTEVLETLERVAITGDTAIFILANLQSLEVGA